MVTRGKWVSAMALGCLGCALAFLVEMELVVGLVGTWADVEDGARKNGTVELGRGVRSRLCCGLRVFGSERK